MTSDPDFKVTTLLVLNISETTRDRAIVTVERQSEVICTLSSGDIFNDRAFQGQMIFDIEYLIVTE